MQLGSPVEAVLSVMVASGASHCVPETLDVRLCDVKLPTLHRLIMLNLLVIANSIIRKYNLGLRWLVR